MSRSRVFKRLLCIVLAITLAGVLAVGILVAVGRSRLAARHTELPNLADGAEWYWRDASTLVADGTVYTPRENLFTLLCTGLGSSGERQANGQVMGLGVADTLVLVCFDLASGELTLLCIPRDTQTQIDWCDAEGVPYLTQQGHIALQYTYGGAAHEVCSESMVDAVSKMLSGAGISAWLTVDMDSIVTLADAVDGIPVTVPDDPYYCAYTGYQPGQWVCLDGAAALQFVQYRDISIFASCEMRVERQKVFLNNLLDLLRQLVTEAPWELPGVYSAMQGQYYTDLTVPEIAALAFAALKVKIDSIAMNTLPGEVRKGALYEEYYLDEQGTKRLLLNAFYQPAV